MTKLISLLRALQKNEWRWFCDYVASPYFNKNEDLLRLCEHFRELARRDMPAAALKKEKIYQKIFPGKAFDEAHFHHLCSDLLKLGEAFLGQRQWEQRAVDPESYQLDALLGRELDKSYSHQLKRTKESLTAGLTDVEQLRLSHKLAMIEERHFLSKNLRTHDPYLQLALDGLERYYLSQKLAYVCAMLDRMRIIQSQYTIEGLEALSAQALAHLDDEHPAVRMYSLTMALLSASDEAVDYYDRFCGALIDLRHCFGQAELGIFFNYGANYCINKIKQGNRLYVNKLVGWYKQGLAHGLLMDGEYLSPWTFKNVVRLGLGIQDYAWVADFIASYTESLPPEYRKDALHFNEADLAYHRRQFDEVFFHLNQVEFTDIYYSLGAKVMLLKIYYETRADEAFLSMAASFRTQLSRNRALRMEAKLPYINFLKVLLRIYRAKPDMLPGIQAAISDTLMLNDRLWLSKQCEA